MPQGGKVTFETADVELDENSHTLHHCSAPGTYVMLAVTDTGHGMDAELQSHIFEPFFTTKDHGTGLGLATVYGVVKQSGGFISLQSEVGKGTTFRIYLPRASQSAAKVQDFEPLGTAAPERRTVLLVEDEHALRKLTRKTLLGAGFAVLEAEDAFEAIEIAKRTGTHIDLLLTDVIMPGMSGRALAETLSLHRPEMRVVYMSGYSDGAIANHGVVEPELSILRKPFSRDELMKSLKDVSVSVSG
jgi:two-component system cell cycle sensor histidine kinase/response regulator CckA